MLELKDVCRFFGGVRAVDGVSFCVSKGQIKSIIGPNGAGKTTLFNVIAGNMKPTKGNIRLQNRNVTMLPDYKMASLGVTRTFQTIKIFSNMTVLENVMIARHPRSRAGFFSAAFRFPWMRREETSLIRESRKYLEFFDLLGKADHPAHTLPFKEQRLLEFARALANEPVILLADEPAAGLNTRETKDIAALIKRIRDTGVTVLLVEHDMSLVMDISDEILVLDFGKKIAEGTPEHIRKNDEVIAVYLGRRAEGA
ncbi:ABC transporter ATP-binding protein [Candidatus Sumerlaeota bacterium]|nr:ABC transporter ATP-binding protein [Candidatus Sumerlaeota bacterium]